MSQERPHGPEIRVFVSIQVKVVATKVTTTVIKKACLVIHAEDGE